MGGEGLSLFDPGVAWLRERPNADWKLLSLGKGQALPLWNVVEAGSPALILSVSVACPSSGKFLVALGFEALRERFFGFLTNMPL